MVRVIINSDDFGGSAMANRAVEAAFKQGLISSASTMVNMDEHTLQAAEKAEQQLVPDQSLGIHINLTSGIPLTEGIKKDDVFCTNGQFHGKIRNRPLFFLSAAQRKNVREEMESQLERFCHLFKTSPSHIDSHHHVHNEWPIADILIDLADQYDIRAMRIARNCGERISLPKRMYKALLNKKIRRSISQTTDYFGSLEDIKHTPLMDGKTYEIMVHALADGNQVMDEGKSLSSILTAQLPKDKIELIGYREL